MRHREGVVVDLIRNYAAAKGCAVTTASRLLTGSGDTLQRLEEGASISRQRADATVEAAFKAWPATAPWPPSLRENIEELAHGALARELNPTRLVVEPSSAPGSTKGRT